MSGTYTVTMVADGDSHVFAGLSAKDTTHLLRHFETNALGKIVDMIGEADDNSGDGANNVSFSCRTVRDSDGKDCGGQSNDWNGVSDAVVGALHGAFDNALAKLDKRLAAKKK